MKNVIFNYAGAILLAFSISGLLLHALFRLDVTSHYCKFLLLSTPEDHLLIYTITASLAAVFFSILKRKKRKFS